MPATPQRPTGGPGYIPLPESGVTGRLAQFAIGRADQVVLVTGAGGSIGSELVRQVARFGARRILLLGRGENSIYQILGECRRTWPELDVVPLTAPGVHGNSSPCPRRRRCALHIPSPRLPGVRDRLTPCGT